MNFMKIKDLFPDGLNIEGGEFLILDIDSISSVDIVKTDEYGAHVIRINHAGCTSELEFNSYSDIDPNEADKILFGIIKHISPESCI
jgi:hypothetical protein